VLPNAADQYEVEGEAQLINGRQSWQLVRHPAYTRIGVALLAFRAHRGRGLDRNHIMTKPGQQHA
jgi:hypothetical protein